MRQLACTALLLLVSTAASARPTTDDTAPADLSSIYLRAASHQASPLARLALSGMGAMQSQVAPSSSVTRAQWLQLRDAALQDGRQDPMVQALALQMDQSPTTPANAAPRAAANRVLQQAIAQNGFFGLVLFSRADTQADPTRVAALLHQAAQAKTYRSVYGPLLRAVYPTFDGLAWGDVLARAQIDAQGDEDSAQMLAGAIAVEFGLPGFGVLHALCKDAVGSVREDCRALNTRIAAEGETAFEVAIAMALVQHLADKEADKAHALIARRRLSWQLEQFASLHPDPHGAEAHAYFRATLQQGELAAMRSALVQAKRPLDPPDGWHAGFEIAPATPRR